MNDVKKNLGQNENTTVILSFSENKKVRKLGNFSWIWCAEWDTMTRTCKKFHGRPANWPINELNKLQVPWYQKEVHGWFDKLIFEGHRHLSVKIHYASPFDIITIIAVI